MIFRVVVVAAALAGAAIWQLELWPHWETRVAVAARLEEVGSAPERFRGERVKVEGRVAGRISLLGLSAFVLEDADGYTIDVLGFRVAPEPGQTLAVIGEVKMLPVPGMGSIPLLMAE